MREKYIISQPKSLMTLSGEARLCCGNNPQNSYAENRVNSSLILSIESSTPHYPYLSARAATDLAIVNCYWRGKELWRVLCKCALVFKWYVTFMVYWLGLDM